MEVAEFYLPLSFLHVLLKVNRKNQYQILQMEMPDFEDYMNASQLLEIKEIPPKTSIWNLTKIGLKVEDNEQAK